MFGVFPTMISDWVVGPTSAGFVWDSQYQVFRESLATAIRTLTRWFDSWSRTKIDPNNESGEFSSLGRRWLDEIDSVAGGAWLTMGGRGWRDECRTTWQLTPCRNRFSLVNDISRFLRFSIFNFAQLSQLPSSDSSKYFSLYFCDYATSAVGHKTNFKQLLKQCCTVKRSKLSFVQSELFLCFFYFFQRITSASVSRW